MGKNHVMLSLLQIEPAIFAYFVVFSCTENFRSDLYLSSVAGFVIARMTDLWHEQVWSWSDAAYACWPALARRSGES